MAISLPTRTGHLTTSRGLSRRWMVFRSGYTVSLLPSGTERRVPLTGSCCCAYVGVEHHGWWSTSTSCGLDHTVTIVRFSRREVDAWRLAVLEYANGMLEEHESLPRHRLSQCAIVLWSNRKIMAHCDVDDLMILRTQGGTYHELLVRCALVQFSQIRISIHGHVALLQAWLGLLSTMV